MRRILCASAVLLSMTGCREEPPAALGTLERDRISLPAPVSERIEEIVVREGDEVEAGQLIATLATERARARVQAAQAEVERLRQARAEVEQGPRVERIDEARQRVARARTVADEARREADRVAAVVDKGLLPRAERDRSRSAAMAAEADARAAHAALAELEHGSRPEAIAQADAAVLAAEATLAALQVDLERSRITAPRSGTIDSLPYEAGDQPPAGAPLATLLVGERVYARVHVPQPLRLGVSQGSAATVHLQNGARSFRAQVRSIRQEANFTPYYALSGEDSAQLSYLAEVELAPDEGVATLPLGVPVRVTFETADTR